MKAEKKLNKKILKLTMMIGTKYPELSKYIDEMWIDKAESNSMDIRIKNLKEYQNSLLTLFKSYQHQRAELIKQRKADQKRTIKFKIEKENKMLLIMESSLSKKNGELIQYKSGIAS